MRRTTTTLVAGAAIATLATALTAPAQAGGGHPPGRGDHGSPSPDALRTVTALDGPRGLDALGRGRTLVSEADGTFSLVLERRRRAALVVPLGRLGGEGGTGVAPAVAAGRHGTVYLLSGGAPPDAPGGPVPGAATLFVWHPGDEAPAPLADIGAYQATDPDPDDLEGLPADSNPFGLAVGPGGEVLVADAAGNDLLRVDPRSGDVETVARLRPRTVVVGPGLPGAGTSVPAEAVATSVAVDSRGAYYVGELRGFPATPGTSEVWRIDPGAVDAVCDPAAADTGSCRRYADGLTSVVDLAVGERGTVYAVSLSTASWLAVESGVPGSEVGGLYALTRTRGPQARGHGGTTGATGTTGAPTTEVSELLAGRLVLPSGVDVAGDDLYLTGPIFPDPALGQGSLSTLPVGGRG